jgi:hypothetical protein
MGGVSRRTPLFAIGRMSGWLILPVYAAGALASYRLEGPLGLRNENPFEDVVMVVGFGAFAMVGALVVVKRPANPIGWILAAAALLAATFPTGAPTPPTRWAPEVGLTSDVFAVLGALAQSWYWFLLISLAFVYLPLLFPDGRRLSRRWLSAALPPGIGTLAIIVLGSLTETLTGQNVDYRIDNPTTSVATDCGALQNRLI